MIIDFHTHFYPEKIAEKALTAIAGIPGMKTYTDGTLNGLKLSMSAAGIDIAVGLPLANTSENVHGVNRWAALHNKLPVVLTGSIHPDTSDPEKTIRWIAGLGLKGIKVHPEYQNFRFSERHLDPIWQACIDNDLFVITHAGGDINFSPPFRSNPAELADFHNRFPKLKLVLAHLGSWGMWDEVDKYLVGLPLYFDTAFIGGYLTTERAADIIRRHGADRILFGTDSPWRCQAASMRFIRSLALSVEEQEMIFYKNAALLLEL
ncbi:MAG: amidohydrolase family protein [Victivallaceae bacterium]